MDILIKLDGTNNTRDIGGLLTESGKKIKKGLLFRSDKLLNLSDNDLDKLRNIGIKKIIDFRSDKEKNKEPNRITTDITYLDIPINPGNMDINELIQNNKIENLLIDANADFVLKHSDKFSLFIKNFIKDKQSTLFHCTLGKDRTGFAAALILKILDVPYEQIIENYIITNNYTKNCIDSKLISICKLFDISEENSKNIRPLLLAKREYIEMAFDTINNYYGSFEIYLNDILGINDELIKELKDFLLE